MKQYENGQKHKAKIDEIINEQYQTENYDEKKSGLEKMSSFSDEEEIKTQEKCHMNQGVATQ